MDRHNTLMSCRNAYSLWVRDVVRVVRKTFKAAIPLLPCLKMATRNPTTHWLLLRYGLNNKLPTGRRLVIVIGNGGYYSGNVRSIVLHL